MGKGEVSKRRRDIRTKENRNSVILEKPRGDHSRKSREYTRHNSRERVGVGTRRIGVLEHVEILSHEIAIREFATRSGPFI
jgi:hypothetical protein